MGDSKPLAQLAPGGSALRCGGGNTHWTAGGEEPAPTRRMAREGAKSGARQLRSRPARGGGGWSPSMTFVRWGCLMGTLLLVACSGTRSSPSTDSDDSGGSRVAAAGFQPLARTQPTESGAWVVDPADPLKLYALGQRSMRSRDGGRSWAELSWPAGAQSLGFAQQPRPALYLRVSDASGAVTHVMAHSIAASFKIVRQRDLQPLPE